MGGAGSEGRGEHMLLRDLEALLRGSHILPLPRIAYLVPESWLGQQAGGDIHVQHPRRSGACTLLPGLAHALAQGSAVHPRHEAELLGDGQDVTGLQQLRTVFLARCPPWDASFRPTHARPAGTNSASN